MLNCIRQKFIHLAPNPVYNAVAKCNKKKGADKLNVEFFIDRIHFGTKRRMRQV